MSSDNLALGEARRRIDEIDTTLQDLLIERSEIVREIGRIKGDDAVYMRPGREAQILRRLIGRHHGLLPKALIVRIWREMIAELTALQGPLAVAVYVPEGSFGYRNLARDHFGWRTPLTAHQTPGRVLEAVMEGHATVGVLPLPGREGARNWWTALAGRGAQVPRIFCRLPFAVIEPPRGDTPEALAIGSLPPEPSGCDRSFLIIETLEPMSRSQLRTIYEKCGFAIAEIQVSADDGGRRLEMVEVEGFVEAEDPRLAALVEQSEGRCLQAWSAGAFSVPLSLEEMTAQG